MKLPSMFQRTASILLQLKLTDVSKVASEFDNSSNITNSNAVKIPITLYKLLMHGTDKRISGLPKKYSH
jgi:hypothetical protein